MYLVDVIPIKKGLNMDHLSYFSKQDMSPGSLVNAPIKNRLVPSLVLRSKKVKELKSTLRKSEYPIKKIGKLISKDFLLPDFIKTSFEMAEFYASHHPSVFKSLVPAQILDGKLEKKINTEKQKGGGRFRAESLQEAEGERLSFYKSLIRESFGKKESVFIVLPSKLDIEFFNGFLSKGIENYSFIFHSQISSKKIIETWQKALAEKHPILIISTPLFLSIPRTDIGTFVCDKENSRAYKQINRPFIDWRRFIENLAKTSKKRVIFGDEVLRTETIYRTENNELKAVSKLKYRSHSNTNKKIVNLLKKEDEPFRYLSEEVIGLLKKAGQDNQKSLIITGRRGLHSSISCDDCGHIIFCPNCHSPFVLHKEGEKRFFICHKCQEKNKAFDRCPNCDGARLKMLGGGTESIFQEIKKTLNIKPLILDSDKAKTPTQAKKITKDFLESSGGVMIGTEMALFYIHEEVENVIVAGIDNLFTIPSFRISERILSLIIKARKIATANFILQTRNPEEKVFQYVMEGNLLDFFRDEISERKKMHYPPFYTLIKISRSGDKSDIAKDMEMAYKLLSTYNPQIFPAFIPIIKKKNILHMLIRVKSDKWPNPELISKLKQLPPEFSIDVEPEEIM